MTSDERLATRRRPWPVTAIGLLLLFQAPLLLGVTLIVIGLALPDEDRALVAFWQTLRDDPLGISYEILRLPHETIALRVGADTLLLPVEAAVSAWLLPFILPAILVGLLFLRLWPPAWSGALLLQAALLIVCLRIYSGWSPAYIALVMLSPIGLIVYLNYYEVRLAFEEPAHRQAPVVRDLKGDS